MQFWPELIRGAFLIEFILKVIWLLLPSYTPNNFAVVFGGGKPIDFGKKFIDGKRILGDGKTFRGFGFGLLGGFFVANLQLIFERIFNIMLYSSLNYWSFFVLVLSLSFGSLFGDLVGSFLKRRLNIERGGPAPLLDQLDFLIFSFIFAYLISPHFKVFFTFDVILTAFIITPILHVLTNYIAYKLKLKEVPW